MEKHIRRAVRCCLIEDGKVLTIKYLTGPKVGYFDLPGGKIELGETPEEATIREMKEETGIDVIDLVRKGIFEAEYPSRKYIFDVFLITKYKGMPSDFEENTSQFILLEELLKKEKILSNIFMLDRPFINSLLNDDMNFHTKVKTDENENVINFEYRIGSKEKVLKAGCILLDSKSKKIGLVFRKKQADYSFAKGHLEEGETLSECALRETEEETGRRCKLISEKELGVLRYITKKGENVDTYIYLAIDEGISDKVISEDLKEVLEWIDIDEVENVLTHDDLKELWCDVKNEVLKYIQ